MEVPLLPCGKVSSDQRCNEGSQAYSITSATLDECVKNIKLRTIRAVNESEVSLRVFEVSDEAVGLCVLKRDTEPCRTKRCTHYWERSPRSEHGIGTELKNRTWK